MFSLILDEAGVLGRVSFAAGKEPEMGSNLFQQLMRIRGTGLPFVSTTAILTENDGVDETVGFIASSLHD
jgi:hypothetical protein